MPRRPQCKRAFALPSPTHGDPEAAARAVAGLDYLAGALNTDPVYKYLSPIADQDMLRARREVRRVLGIVPTATSQQVVNALTTGLWSAGPRQPERGHAGFEFAHIYPGA